MSVLKALKKNVMFFLLSECHVFCLFVIFVFVFVFFLGGGGGGNVVFFYLSIFLYSGDHV